MRDWTFDDVPDQTGRAAIVAGANTGLVLEAGSVLARPGADVVRATITADARNEAVAGR